jgi:hypothetical protein
MALGDINWTEVGTKVRAAANQYQDIAYNNDSYLLNLIPKTPPSDAGRSVWRVRHTGAEARGFREGDAMKAPSRFEDAGAELPMGSFNQVVEFTGHAMKRLENAGEMQIANYVNELFQDAANSIFRRVEALIPGGTDAESNFVGLGDAIDDGNIYAGLNRASISNFRSHVNDNGGTPRAVTTALIEAVHGGLVYTNRGRYNAVLLSPTQGNALRNLVADTKKPTVQVNLSAGQPIEMSLGIGTVMTSGLFIRGVPVLEIPAYPTDRIDYLHVHPDYVRLEEHQQLSIEGPFTDLGSDRVGFKMIYRATLCLRSPRMAAARLADLS